MGCSASPCPRRPHVADPVLRVEGLCKRFGGLLANDAISLEVSRGEVHAVIGPNGAGKTTFIAQLCGEIAPDAGRVLLGGVDVTRQAPHQRARAGLARSFQITSIMPSLTVREHVALAVAGARGEAWRPWRRLLDQAAIARCADEAIARLGLGAKAEYPGMNLSHGERRQLEIAMAVALGPSVLLLDEPAAGLGMQESAALGALIRELGRDVAVVLVEHDMDIVFSVADTVTVLVEGRVIASGPPGRIRDDPDVRRAYLGDDDA